MSMKEKPKTPSETVVVILSRWFILTVCGLLVSCSDYSSDLLSPQSNAFSLATPGVFQRMLDYDESNLHVEVSINDGEKITFRNPESAGGIWQIKVPVNYDEVNSINVAWFEIYRNSILLLAEQSGVFFADAETNSGEINAPHITSGDVRFDADNDGVSNLEERKLGTEPLPLPNLLPVVDPDDGTPVFRPYRTTGQYSNNLKDCALIDSADSSFTLLTLHFIGQEISGSAPTVDQILERVLVTHDWMGDRFAQVLANAPADVLGLFKSITAIMIGSNIRPTRYSTFSGAIYIDPARLWLTVPEKATISRADDFRVDFGSELQFIVLTRWMIGEQYAFPAFSLDDDSEREIQDILASTMSVLFHFLAHANDFVPVEVFSELDFSQSVYENISSVSDRQITAQLHQSIPVAESPLYGLAAARYRGVDPTDQQKQLQAADVGSLMANEGLTDLFSYVSVQEDLTNLFQATMLSFHYGITRSIGFTSKPDDPDICANLLVGWGMRNRLAAPLVATRAKWVTEKLLGSSTALDNFFAERLGSTSLMRVGEDWCSNRILNP